MLRNGEILDNTYEILGEIGEGGAGVVYQAYHLRLQKYVVLKRVKDHIASRFNIRGEVDILKKLHHEYLPQVYDFLDIEGGIFTVIDYIAGHDLMYYVQKDTVFEEKQLLLWMRQLCEVLSYLHSQKPAIIHSDIKPANIMITSEGNVCLIDFNISLDEDQASKISGLSNHYASPEQLEKGFAFSKGMSHEHILLDGRTDIYSLGAAFYYLMTGIPPAASIYDRVQLKYIPTHYSNAIVEIVDRAMENDREKRYQSAEKMLHALNNISKLDTTYKRFRKIDFIVTAACILIIIISGFNVYFGKEMQVNEKFQQDYRMVINQASANTQYSVIAPGLDLLNEGRYQKLLKSKDKEKAQILYLIGDEYFYEGEYREAASYFEEAVSLWKNSPEYFRDYAISLARQELITEAEEVLEEAMSYHIKEEHLAMMRAEIALNNDQAEQSLDLFEEAAAIASDSTVQERIYYLWAQACEQNGDYKGRIQVLEKMKALELGMKNRAVRDLGDAYTQYAQIQEDDVTAAEYYQKAAENYNLLEERGVAEYQDRIRLALAYEGAGLEEECEKLLLELESSEEADYQVFMHLTYLNLRKQEKRLVDNRNYKTADTYYKKALEAYEKQAASGVTDVLMNQLSELFRELYEQDWL